MSMRAIKLCLLGDSGVGKTSVVQRFVLDSFKPGTEMTIGLNGSLPSKKINGFSIASFMSKTLILDDRTFCYQIWDTAGQEKYRALAPMYYRGSAAAIVVYDVTNEETFKGVKSWIKELQQQGPKNIVIAIAGNKIDLEDEREVSTEEAKKYCQGIGAIFLETSALTAVGVNQLFIDISERLPGQNNPLTVSSDGVRVGMTVAKKEDQSSKCCGTS